MNATSQPRQKCPSCAHELRRLAPQHGDGEQPLNRRYGCVREGCSWQGLLPRMAPRAKPSAAQLVKTELKQGLNRISRRYAIALGVAVLVLGGLGLWLSFWSSEPEIPVIGLTQKR
jgi:hypothetical protein